MDRSRESVHTFGMRFPIDLVYVDRKHRVRKVRSGVRPWRMSACLTAHSVIELPDRQRRGHPNHPRRPVGVLSADPNDPDPGD